jgi:WD40 repeat protein
MNNGESIQTKPEDICQNRIDSFRHRFGDRHFYLACHAALPLSFTPDLLYCLWANFQQDIYGERLNIPWIAVSDLLLSGLCEEVGHELYEMESGIRNKLLNYLGNNPRFGLQRVRDLAGFTIDYVTPQLDSPDLDIWDLATTQKWTAMAYQNPDRSAYEIASTLALLDPADKTEWIRMATILRTLAEPLFDFQHLVVYACAMADYSQGNLQAAFAKFNSLHIASNKIQIAGVNLTIADTIKSEISRFEASLCREYGFRVYSVAFSPDGNTIVSGSWDKTLQLWDVHTGKPKGDPLRGHKKGVYSIAFSPDSTTIASGSFDRTVRLWDAHTRKPKGDPLRGHENVVNSVAFSPDGNTIISGSWDKTVRLWDSHTGKPKGDPLRGHKKGVYSVAFSPDSNTIVSASNDKTVRLWDAHTRKPKGDPLRGHEDVVNSVAFSPDGDTIVSGSWDRMVRRWDAHTGKPKGDPLQGHKAEVNSVAFSPDGNTIVSGSNDKTIRLWDAHTGKPKGDPLQGHESWIYSVAFSPDSNTIISGSNDKTMRLWDIYGERWQQIVWNQKHL